MRCWPICFELISRGSRVGYDAAPGPGAVRHERTKSKQILSFGFVEQLCIMQQRQNICITFIQRGRNVFDIGLTLCKCYTNVLCLLGRVYRNVTPECWYSAGDGPGVYGYVVVILVLILISTLECLLMGSLYVLCWFLFGPPLILFLSRWRHPQSVF